MRPLSPTEAINPAISRTRAVLFQPFRLGRSWKLAFFAYLALCGSAFYPFAFVYFGFLRVPGTTTSLIYLVWAGVLAATAIQLLLFYLGSRIQFVLLDYVLTPSPLIAPLWRRYGDRTWRWIGLKLAIFVPLSFAVLLPLYPVYIRLFKLFPRPQNPPQPIDPAILGAILSAYLIVGAAMSLIFLVGSILSDFILPSIALEDATVSESLRRFGTLCQQEPLTLIGYLCLRILLAICGVVLQYAATLIVMLLFALVLGATAFAGWFVLHTLVPKLILIVGGVALYLVCLVCLFYIQLGTFGALNIFFRAYSLYFLGGRYPLLGNILEPHPPPPPIVQYTEV